MNGQEPALTQTDPKAYYLWLQGQGVPPNVAVQYVQNRFGSPQEYQQRQNKKQAGNSTNNALATTGGMIAGAIAGRFILQQGGKFLDTLTNQIVSADTVKEIVTQSPQAVANTGVQAGSAAASAGGALPNVDGNFQWETPEFQYDPSSSVTVDTPAGPQEMTGQMANNQEFLSGVNWDAVGKGTVSLMQAYQAYQAYKQKDYLGTGIYGTAAVTGGAAAASSAGVGGSTATTMGAWAPYAGAIAGVYGGYKTAEALSDMAAGSQRTRTGIVGGASSGAAIGASIGSAFPVIGTGIGAAVGGVVGGVAGAIGSWTGSSKGKAQMHRDKIREVLQENKILDENWQGTLADGTKYDFGKDGSTMKWKEIDKIAEANPNTWGAAIPLTNALATAYGWVGQKASDIAAWYNKAAVSNAGQDPEVAKQNARHFAAQQGITFDLIKSKLEQAYIDDRIDKTQYDYYLNGAKDLTNYSAKETPETYQQQANDLEARRQARIDFEREYAKQVIKNIG